MARIIKEILVDVAKKNLFQSIVAKQNDSNSRFLKVTMCNEGVKLEIPSTATVVINAERADASAKAFSGTVNQDGTVTVPLTNWMLELDDIVRCSVSVIDSNDERLTSTSFTVDVEAAEVASGDIPDDDKDKTTSIITEALLLADGGVYGQVANASFEDLEGS